MLALICAISHALTHVMVQFTDKPSFNVSKAIRWVTKIPTVRGLGKFNPGLGVFKLD